MRGNIMFHVMDEEPLCAAGNAPDANETKHGLRFMFGIGLSKSVWPEFQKRFKVCRNGYKVICVLGDLRQF